jgi:outer membrane protein assembly factor BamA
MNTSLPYDYSFYAGGSNDNRGWRARSLGPGAYKYHLDTNRTLTQIGDVRIGASLEYRFSLGPILKGAVFTDIGNIWTYNEDSREAQFKIQNVFKEMAIASGIGLRIDLDYFIVRLDLGFPIYNPAYSQGARWTFQDLGTRETYIQEGIDRFILPGDTPESARARAIYYLPKPFWPTLHFGIGYPF